MTLEQALADWRETANRARYLGHTAQAVALEKCLDDVELATLDYRAWLSEAEAVLRSGWSPRRLRGHFAEWSEQGMAEKRGRVRYYRQVMVPRRANLEAARSQAERMAKAS